MPAVLMPRSSSTRTVYGFSTPGSSLALGHLEAIEGVKAQQRVRHLAARPLRDQRNSTLSLRRSDALEMVSWLVRVMPALPFPTAGVTRCVHGFLPRCSLQTSPASFSAARW
jgi:hypothetical protein